MSLPLELPGDMISDINGQLKRRPRLLVVDDQAINIELLYQIFAGDHQVLMATNGEQAVNLCLAKHPDLVLLDVEMPGMNGYEVCQRLKADLAVCGIPVVFITTHTDPEFEEYGLDCGAVDFITRPFNQKVVRARVKTHLTLKMQADLLRRMAYLDGLTGVFNRRYFNERLSVEWLCAMRNRSPLGLILLDIDFFKRYNDHNGHQAGDDCLRQVATALNLGLKRPGDIMARYGGEEFVCLLPDTSLEGALQVAQQLCQQVSDCQIPHLASDVASVVTVSLGVCSMLPKASSTESELLGHADAQLYKAKGEGRNRICGCEIGCNE